jgi:hypothetical protein
MIYQILNTGYHAMVVGIEQWDVHPCRFKHQKLPQQYEKIDSKYSWWVRARVYTRL